MSALCRLVEADEADAHVAAVVQAARNRFERARAQARPLQRVARVEVSCCPRCDELAEEVRALRELMFRESAVAPIMAWGGLTESEARLFAVLLARPLATKDALHAALYGDDPDGGAELKIIDVLICKVRGKLKRRGLAAIETVWGVGYQLAPAARGSLNAHFASLREAADV
ncbi:MAG TPA: helix-turn-helix domain-containing protein [Vitreimonas sp.]|uniref:helix-turn-helix domain-containing protein n=1 Tax=Vitreimonas sp. TaxID=3069702 RepID=UPI002D2A1F09|nr:helix-turn-helix domain-containing protein [Vitreimonas sp.]HYD87135.1 helix-turn-helix domain-containing protein [Vitreimonas sp.]